MDALEDDLNEKLTIDENLSNPNKSIVVEWSQEEKNEICYFVYIRLCKELTFIVFVLSFVIFFL